MPNAILPLIIAAVLLAFIGNLYVGAVEDLAVKKVEATNLATAVKVGEKNLAEYKERHERDQSRDASYIKKLGEINNAIKSISSKREDLGNVCVNQLIEPDVAIWLRQLFDDNANRIQAGNAAGTLPGADSSP